MEEIVIKNKRILQFYSQNPQINIETINLLIIDRDFTMPKAFRRFLKKLPKKIQTLKYSFREFLSSKI